MNIEDIKYVFLDIDGTLSAPVFKGDRRWVSGFSDEDWLRVNVQGYSYDKCIAPKLVKDYIRALSLAGKKLFCLTTETFSFAYYNKVRFILENYPEIENQEDILFVSKDSDKITLIKEIASRDDIKLSECLLVEDTFSTILLAEQEYISTMHISHLLNWEGLDVTVIEHD